MRRHPSSLYLCCLEEMLPLILLVLYSLNLLSSGEQEADISGNSTSKATLNVLVMVPWPDKRDEAITGWDNGLAFLAGAQVAVEEVNRQRDILHDYKLDIIVAGHEACDLNEVALGVPNLVHLAINPDAKNNVAAILGLYCSASSLNISPISSTRNVDLIQMAVSNSPIFKQNPDRYQHQWRFLLSASVFADMMIEFMKMYEWTRVGLVQDLRSAYFMGIANAFVSAVNAEGLDLAYHGGVVKDMFIYETLSDIRNSRVRVIFVSLSESHVAALLCEAKSQGMVYPNYMWVFADNTLDLIVGAASESCNKNNLLDALKGSVMSFFDFHTDNATIIEPPMIKYSEFVEKYNAELSKVQVDYQQLLNETGDKISSDQAYAGLLYDQVWAFALAVNNSLPELKLKNVSIEDYRFGQPNVTSILEDGLQKLNFRGVTGQIHFNKYRETGPPVAVFQVIDTDEVPIGRCYTTVNGSISCAEVNISGVIDDDVESVVVKFPSATGVSLIIFICAVIVMITLVFILLMYHRAKPEIKATSPYLSSIMFLGSYLLCLAALLHTLMTTFHVSTPTFEFICNAEFILGVNGCNLIFVTLFIKLYRISRIFNNDRLSNLSWTYNNYCLSVIVLILCCLPCVILVIMVGIDHSKQQSLIIYVSDHGMLQDNVQYLCYSSEQPFLWFFLIFGYLSIFIVFIVYLAISSRKIKLGDFKDTKKVNAFIFLTLLSFSLPLPCSVIALASGNYYLGNAIIIFGLLILATLSQIMLFLPKILPVVFCEHRNVDYIDTYMLSGFLRKTSIFSFKD